MVFSWGVVMFGVLGLVGWVLGGFLGVWVFCEFIFIIIRVGIIRI